MTGVIGHVAMSPTGFRPLAPLLQLIAPERLRAVQLRVAGLTRTEIITRFRLAFNADKRMAALAMADELIQRGIPPCFWHASAPSEPNLEQRYDLMVFDLRWLRYWHADHYRHVRYGRYKDILISTEAGFHRAAEFAFYLGKRPAWQIIRSLSLTEHQQWDCVWLRLAPLNKHQAVTDLKRNHVMKVLHADLQVVRRTAAFTQDSADIALTRRVALWVCSRMTNDSPTETALRYTQMTGEQITRQTVGKQLQKVREVLRKNEMTSPTKTEVTGGYVYPFREHSSRLFVSPLQTYAQQRS